MNISLFILHVTSNGRVYLKETKLLHVHSRSHHLPVVFVFTSLSAIRGYGAVDEMPRPRGAKSRQSTPAATKESLDQMDFIPATEDSGQMAQMDQHGLATICQHMMLQQIGLMRILGLLNNLQAPTSTGAASNDAANTFVIRYLLDKPGDRKRIESLSPQQIVGAFKAKGDIWEHIPAVCHKGKVLYLYPDSGEAEEKIRMQEQEIRNILQLSKGCKVLWDQYLVVAQRFDFDRNTLPDPDQYKAEWSRVNGVRIVKAYWTHSQLILSLASLEDALTLCKRPSVFLEGRRGIVK